MLTHAEILNLSGQLNHDLLEPLNSVIRKCKIIQLKIDTLHDFPQYSEILIQYVSDVSTISSNLIVTIRDIRDSVVNNRLTSDIAFRATLESLLHQVDRGWAFIRQSDPSSIEVLVKFRRELLLIKTSYHRFRRMLGALLAISKISSPHFIITNYRITATLSAIILRDNLGNIAPELDKASVFSFSPESAIGYADQGMIGTIFQNIYSNSIKYRSTRPLRIHTDIRITSRGECVERFPNEKRSISPLRSLLIHASVSDNGIGIEDENLPRIFEPYTQVHERSPGGDPVSYDAGNDYSDIGIGLFTVRKMVLEHKGHIFASSNGEDGTTIHILFDPDPRPRDK